MPTLATNVSEAQLHMMARPAVPRRRDRKFERLSHLQSNLPTCSSMTSQGLLTSDPVYQCSIRPCHRNMPDGILYNTCVLEDGWSDPPIQRTYRFSSSCLVVKYPSSPFSRSALQLKVCEVVDQVVSLLINKFGSVGESFLQLKGRYISERVVEIYRPLDRSGGAWISTAQRRWRYRYRIRSAIPMD